MKRMFSSLIVLGLLAGLFAAAVGTASAQIAAEAQLGVLNGTSADPLSVTINGRPVADGLEYAAPPVTGIGAADAYVVEFSDGSSGVAVLVVGQAGTMVSGHGDEGATAMFYPAEVAPIDAGMAKYNVSNATVSEVQVSVSIDEVVLFGDITLGPGDSIGAATVAAGTIVTVVVDLNIVEITAEEDSYTDAFIVNDGTANAIALAPIASMTDLIEAITPTEPPSGVIVPDVVGHPQADAELTIAGAGLVAATSLVPHDTVDEGLVIETSPTAGTEVEIGSQVSLSVSTGPPPPTVIEVPDVVGDASDDAVATLEDAGLTTEIVEQESEEIDAGLVIETNPQAGTEVAPETLVTVTVSTGPGETTVPDFYGMTTDEAQAAADNAGLTLEIILDPQDPDEDGIVVDQDPEAGTTVDIGSEAQVLLSPFVEDAWTIVKVDFNRILTVGGLRFEPGSISEATVLGTTLSAKAVVDETGYWIDLNVLDGSTRELLVTGTAADGSDYEQLFTIPEAGDTTDEVVVEETGFPIWGWVVLGIALLAAVLLVILLVTGGPSSGDVGDADGGEEDSTDTG
jgi:beta-lactam-binding protein with PASTA domain